MTAGELGADYVSFGPVGNSPLFSGETAPLDLFQWWSQMIEVPVVAEGSLDVDLIRQLTPYTDFFGIGDEIWTNDDPVAALRTLVAAMS
jgi:thiamine-phosphate pyrophosphorylase